MPRLRRVKTVESIQKSIANVISGLKHKPLAMRFSRESKDVIWPKQPSTKLAVFAECCSQSWSHHRSSGSAREIWHSCPMEPSCTSWAAVGATWVKGSKARTCIFFCINKLEFCACREALQRDVFPILTSPYIYTANRHRTTGIGVLTDGQAEAKIQ